MGAVSLSPSCTCPLSFEKYRTRLACLLGCAVQLYLFTCAVQSTAVREAEPGGPCMCRQNDYGSDTSPTSDLWTQYTALSEGEPCMALLPSC